MPEKRTEQRAGRSKPQGKATSTQAGEFVPEEVHHVRSGRHGARSTEQAVAIGLPKARRSGVNVAPPKRGKTSEGSREKAERETSANGRRGGTSTSPAPSASRALEHEPSSTTPHRPMSKMASGPARRRSPSSRHEAAVKTARTRARRRSGGARKGPRSGTASRSSG